MFISVNDSSFYNWSAWSSLDAILHNTFTKRAKTNFLHHYKTVVYFYSKQNKSQKNATIPKKLNAIDMTEVLKGMKTVQLRKVAR